MGGSWKGRWYGAVALIALCMLVALPGLFSLPVVDRDEARFAQASRQMLEALTLPPDQRDPALHAGAWAVPMLGDRPRLNKPPLIYWLQAASAWLCTGGHPERDAIWMYRLPSVLALIIVVLMTWRLGMDLFNWPTAFLGACMMAVSPVFAWEAHQARADMVLVALTCIAMWGLWHTWRPAVGGMTRSRATSPTPNAEEPRPSRAAPSRRGPWPAFIALWGGLALGVLDKGPITPMIVILSAITLSIYTRSWRWMRRARPIFGILLVVAMVLPWVWAVGSRVGWNQYARIVLDETLGRSAAAQEGHWGPPGYHLIFLIVLFWPGVLITGMAFAEAIRRGWSLQRTQSPVHDHEAPPITPRRTRALASAWHAVTRARIDRPAEAFCVGWILPSWIIFELVSTKLPHYTMPLYPPIALISARGIHWAISGALPNAFSRMQRIGYTLWTLFPFIVGIGSLALGAALLRGVVAIAVMLFGAASLLVAIALLRVVLTDRLLLATRLAIAYAATMGFIIIGLAFPDMNMIWATRSLQRALADVDPTGTRPVGVAGYTEDSLRFAFRGDMPIADPATWFTAHPDGLLVIAAEDTDPPTGAFTVLHRFHAFDYAGGDALSFAIVEHP